MLVLPPSGLGSLLVFLAFSRSSGPGTARERRAKRSQLKPLSGGAERAREAPGECCLDALAALVPLAPSPRAREAAGECCLDDLAALVPVAPCSLALALAFLF